MLCCRYMGQRSWCFCLFICTSLNNAAMATSAPRTNGGVTLVGTLAAIAGGAFMGATFVLNGYFIHGSVLHEKQLRLILGGALAGLLGTTLDSVLGAPCKRRTCT